MMVLTMTSTELEALINSRVSDLKEALDQAIEVGKIVLHKESEQCMGISSSHDEYEVIRSHYRYGMPDEFDKLHDYLKGNL